MKLYEIEQAILDCVDQETGEIINEEMLESLAMERDAKIEGIALWIKDLKAEAEAIKTEKMNLAKRQTVAENKAESLKNFLTNYLAGNKFKTARVSISYRTSKALQIDEDARIPKKYITYEPKVDKASVKEAIENGKTMKGVSIVTNTNIQIK